MPVVRAFWSILNMDHRSVPESERLKLLLITGKSAMMLPCTASTMAAQLFTDGSLILQRSRRLPGAVRTQCRISPRQPSTALSAQRPGGTGCGGAQCGAFGRSPSSRSLAAARRMANDSDLDLAAPALDGAERATAGRHGLRRRAVRGFRQIAFEQVVGGGAQDGERLLHLIDAHQHAVQDVSGLIHGHVERVAIVGGVRVVAADVQIDAGSAAGDADDA